MKTELLADIKSGRVTELKLADSTDPEHLSHAHWPHFQHMTHEELVKVYANAIEEKVRRGNGKVYDTLKVSSDDVDAYAEATANEYSEARRVNGTIIFKRAANGDFDQPHKVGV